MVYLLNTPVLTSYGAYHFNGPLNIDQARAVLSRGFTSAIGHQTTAELLSRVLGLPVPTRRATIRMQPGDTAVVFRLLQRFPEGEVLSAQALDTLPYELGQLTCLDQA